MTAEEFMRGHAEKASTGRIPEILGDLTPEAMQQLMPLMAGGPNPPTGFTMARVPDAAGGDVFDVTYTGDGGTTVAMRETVRQVDGAWRIVKLEKPG